MANVMVKCEPYEETYGVNHREAKEIWQVSAHNGTSASKIKCVFCDAILSHSQNAMLLECLHSLCLTCLRKFHPGVCNVIFCPKCKFANGSVVENKFLPNVQHSVLMDAIKCTSCLNPPAAAKWCVQCRDFLCDGCVQAHKRLKITKEHTLESIELGVMKLSDNITSNCPKHPSELMNLFCESCNRVICRDCQLLDHYEHKYKFVSEGAVETRKLLKSMHDEVSAKKSEIESVFSVLDERKNVILKKSFQVEEEINRMFTKLINATQYRKAILLCNLKEAAEGKLKSLEQLKDVLAHMSGVTEHCLNFVDDAIRNGSDVAVLENKKNMIHGLHSINERKIAVPDPNSAVNIVLEADNSGEIVKALAHCGAVKTWEDSGFEVATKSSPDIKSSTLDKKSSRLEKALTGSKRQPKIGPKKSSPAANRKRAHAPSQGSTQNKTGTTAFEAAHSTGETTRLPIQQDSGHHSALCSDFTSERIWSGNSTQKSNKLQISEKLFQSVEVLSPANQRSENPEQTATPDNFVKLYNDTGSACANIPTSVLRSDQPLSNPAPSKIQRKKKGSSKMPRLNDGAVDTLEDSQEPGSSEKVKRKRSRKSKKKNSNQDKEETAHSSTHRYLKNRRNSNHEDWCLVCMDGGSVYCCDSCPKVFHMECHTPKLNDDEMNGKFVCMLCRDIQGMLSTMTEQEIDTGSGENQHIIMCRLLLELYCQYETSSVFRNMVDKKLYPDYYKLIKKPTCLGVIRRKLLERRYKKIPDFLADLRLLFSNAYSYNEDGSFIYENGRHLEEFLDQLLSNWLPKYVKFSNLTTRDGAASPPCKRSKQTEPD